MLQSIHRFSSLVCSGKESRSDLRSPFSVCVRTFGVGDRGELVAYSRHSPVQLLRRSLAQFGNSFPVLLLMSPVCAMQIVETYVIYVPVARSLLPLLKLN
jgi:hypothetical protein